ncbi:hypothetical protein PVAND_005814 [Polypedilum vanderplanki]|uniref:Major facilitator superfamily (MFS) profile domain-containing protein n=1 Tax=Polypedilum vanderplanki TaxID=319348 RepID=A0A9J6C262_POLVA|nr:hypothetical protein PVAND_005814 [Polypedilum vanderplanki]
MKEQIWKFIFCTNHKKLPNLSLENELSNRAMVTQVAISLLANLSVLSPGMGLGYPAITSQLLRQDQTVILSESQVSWFASITAIACPIGGPIAAYCTNKFGRKGTLIIIDFISITLWFIIGLSSRNDSQILFIQLMIARFLTGITIGMITTPAVMYSSEICHPKLRGRLTVLSTPFFIAVGMVLVYLLGYLMIDDYRLVSFYAFGITILTLIVCIFMPESPVHLVLKNDIKEAKKVLSLLRNLDENDPKISNEIQQIQQNAIAAGLQTSFLSVFYEFKKPELYKPFFIMLGFFAIQQLSGIFVIFIYAAQFSLEAGVAIDEFLSTVIIGVIRLIMTFIVAFASDKFGRKPIAIVSSSGMFLSMIGLALCSFFSISQSSLFWLPTTFLYFFILTGTIGILALPFSMVAELYPQKSRSIAVGLSLSFCFILSFFTVKTFSTVFEMFGSGIIFSFYAIIALLGILFSLFILPETKDKTLQQIENYFKNQ